VIETVQLRIPLVTDIDLRSGDNEDHGHGIMKNNNENNDDENNDDENNDDENNDEENPAAD
jgi:hypothetical protein